METVRLTTAQAIVKLPDRPANDAGRRRRRGAAVPRRVRHLRPRQRHLPRPRARGSTRTRSRPGAARTNRAWRSPPPPTPRRSAAVRSWSPRRRSVRVPPTWSPPPVSPTPTASRCSSLSGDTFVPAACPTPCCSRSSTSVTPSTTVNDAFRPVTRYWDRIMRPRTGGTRRCPHAIATMLDPADCGPAFLGLPQDVAGRGLSTSRSGSSIRQMHHEIDSASPRHPDSSPCGRRGDRGRRSEAADHRWRWGALLLRRVRAGGLRRDPQHPGRRDRRRQGQRCVPASPSLRRTRSASPEVRVGQRTSRQEADVVLAVGSRLEDFTTGSWTVFKNEATSGSSASTPRGSTRSSIRSLPVVGDAARSSLSLNSAALGDWRGDRPSGRSGPPPPRSPGTTPTSTRSPLPCKRRRGRSRHLRPGGRRWSTVNAGAR